jgi:hypothetical protein
VETYKIIPVVNSAWEKSFAQVDFKKEVIAVRGWNPLTRNLLNHPKISVSREHELKEESGPAAMTSEGTGISSIMMTLNFSTGLSKMVMIDILQNINRDKVRQQIRETKLRASKLWRISTSARS